MARIRSIKPEFFTSLTIASLEPLARLTFIGLWTFVDDNGRGIDDVRLIRSAIWPLDDRSAAKVQSDLKQMESAKLIVRYEVDGVRYLAIRNWVEHQKISNPRPKDYPPPPESFANDSRTIPESFPNGSGTILPHARAEGARAFGKGKGKGEGGARGATLSSRSSKRCPADWQPTDEHRALAAERHADLDLEVAKFRDYEFDKPKSDWEAAFRNWLRNTRPANGARGGHPNGAGESEYVLTPDEVE